MVGSTEPVVRGLGHGGRQAFDRPECCRLCWGINPAGGQQADQAWLGRPYHSSLLLDCRDTGNPDLAGISFNRMAREVKWRMARTFDPSDDFTSILTDTTEGGHWSLIGQSCGWMSAILAAASTITLGISLARL